MRSQLPPVAAVVSHRVSDFEAWKSSFDAHASVRKEATIVGHHLNRDADDPQIVTVYLPATDADGLHGFLSNPELKDKMKEAGVESAPRVAVMKPVAEDLVRDRDTAGAIVRHRVADFAQWKSAFDADAERRRAAGIVGHAVNQTSEDPNDVIIYIQADDQETIRRFVSDPKLREVMAEAGVEGAPEVAFVQGAGWGKYN